MENIVKIEIDGLQLKLKYSEDGRLNTVSKDGRKLIQSFIQIGNGYEFNPPTEGGGFIEELQCDVRCVFIPEFKIYLPMYLYIKE